MSEGQSKKGIGELGPVWITAISTLIVALTGAGFFWGRASAPETRPSSATQTVTVTVATAKAGSPAQQPGQESSRAPSATADPTVAWSGELVWGSYNLDFNPPRQVPGKSFQNLSGSLYTTSAGTLVDWQIDSVPGKDDCATAIAERGTNQTHTLVSDSHVCGRTAEGRFFRIDVLAAGTGEVRSNVVVWAK